MNEGAEDNRAYSVVTNDEEQYSIWLDGRSLPAGWHAVGKTGSKSDCLDYIAEVWTDMRPKSLRQSMDARDLSAAG
ncbi:MbtH family NRPS accessory protein [Streptomyces sp. NPDC048279]|uniref:MbtH family protein n=1 Tax=Streptomyces sp. NPDC048279 TaxID=3154714 RepID=UPI00343B9CB6